MNKIEVLMSTYNGESYISEQIMSILNQKDVDVHITARDDGSTDNTLNILKKLAKKHPGKISIFTGKNIGYRRSFLKLLELSEVEAEYYAFSDQDDIWLENKCKTAIQHIISNGNEIALYVCSPTICNQQMKPLYVNDMSSTDNNVYSYFIRSRFPGCCMTFTKELKNIIINFKSCFLSNYIVDHDFLTGAIAYAYGNVIRDNKSYLLHRRLENSVTSGGKGMINRIKTEFNIIFKKKSMKSDIAAMIYKFNNENLNQDSKILFESIIDYKNNIKKRFLLIFNRRLSSGNILLDLETKARILIKKY